MVRWSPLLSAGCYGRTVWEGAGWGWWHQIYWDRDFLDWGGGSSLRKTSAGQLYLKEEEASAKHSECCIRPFMPSDLCDSGDREDIQCHLTRVRGEVALGCDSQVFGEFLSLLPSRASPAVFLYAGVKGYPRPL